MQFENKFAQVRFFKYLCAIFAQIAKFVITAKQNYYGKHKES